MSNKCKISVQEIVTFEQILISLLTEVGSLREIVRSNPNYSGDWKEHDQFRRTRRTFRSLHNQSEFLKRRRYRG